jgi:hypothetical protein
VRNDTEYTVKTYGTQKVYIPEGMYTIEEVENLLSEMKKAKQIQDEALNKSLDEALNKSFRRSIK